MKGHLLWVESGGKAGRRLGASELKEVASSIRVLAARSKAPRARELLHEKTTEEMIAKLRTFPQMKEALDALEKG